ncbi:hypothetical protein AAAC51_10270 [Priestia megaterium]
MSKAALSDFRNDYGVFHLNFCCTVVLRLPSAVFLVFTLGIVFAIRAFEMQEGEKKTQGNIWLLVGVVMILLDIVLFVVYAINRS